MDVLLVQLMRLINVVVCVLIVGNHPLLALRIVENLSVDVLLDLCGIVLPQLPVLRILSGDTLLRNLPDKLPSLHILELLPPKARSRFPRDLLAFLPSLSSLLRLPTLALAFAFHLRLSFSRTRLASGVVLQGLVGAFSLVPDDYGLVLFRLVVLVLLWKMLLLVLQVGLVLLVFLVLLVILVLLMLKGVYLPFFTLCDRVLMVSFRGVVTRLTLVAIVRLFISICICIYISMLFLVFEIVSLRELLTPLEHRVDLY